MQKRQYKKFYTRLRKIRNAHLVGTHGHYSDLVKEFNVSIEFIRNLNDMAKKPKRIIYGKYTREYIEKERQAAAWDSYHEKRVMA